MTKLNQDSKGDHSDSATAAQEASQNVKKFDLIFFAALIAIIAFGYVMSFVVLPMVLIMVLFTANYCRVFKKSYILVPAVVTLTVAPCFLIGYKAGMVASDKFHRSQAVISQSYADLPSINEAMVENLNAGELRFIENTMSRDQYKNDFALQWLVEAGRSSAMKNGINAYHASTTFPFVDLLFGDDIVTVMGMREIDHPGAADIKMIDLIHITCILNDEGRVSTAYGHPYGGGINFAKDPRMAGTIKICEDYAAGRLDEMKPWDEVIESKGFFGEKQDATKEL